MPSGALVLVRSRFQVTLVISSAVPSIDLIMSFELSTSASKLVELSVVISLANKASIWLTFVWLVASLVNS